MRMSERISIIGATTQDIETLSINGAEAVQSEIGGGGAPYSAMTLHRLGMASHIITKAAADFSFLAELQNYGVTVDRLDVRDASLEPNVATFQNKYDEQGNRTQVVSNLPEIIDQQDLARLKELMGNDSVVFIAPVINEVDPELFSPLSKAGHVLVVTPQGYFRQRREDGSIHHEPWAQMNNLQYADLVVLSHEDLTFNKSEGMDKSTLRSITELCPTVVLTRGSEGLTVFHQGEEPLNIHRFELNPTEIKSPTGAGDSCAAAFLWYTLEAKRRDIHVADARQQAAVFAALYPALKLMGISKVKKGVGALPTLNEVRDYITANPQNRQRYEDFLANNGLLELTLLEKNYG